MVAAVGLVALPAVWPGGRAATPAAAPPVSPAPAAVPPPATDADSVRLWLSYGNPRRLVSLRVDGTVDRTTELTATASIVRIEPRAGRVWFRGKDGQPLGPVSVAGRPNVVRTLHVRPLAGGPATDLGVPLPDDRGILGDDGKTVLVSVTGPPVEGQAVYNWQTTLTDVATKKVTRLAHLPGNHQAWSLFPDGKSVLTHEYVKTEPNQGNKPGKVPSYRSHQVSVAGGEPRLLTGMLWAPFPGTISPDGTKLLVCGREWPWEDAPESDDLFLYVIDVASGKATKISDEAKLGSAFGHWSPDGKRLAYVWKELTRTDEKWVRGEVGPPSRLVVRDADGKNAKTLVSSKEDFGIVAWE